MIIIIGGWKSEEGIEKNIEDTKYNIKKNDTLFLDAHGGSLDELFSISINNKIIVYGRYGDKINSDKLANILGGVCELNKSVLKKTIKRE